jgi:ADP-ribosylglycohydrolase
MAELWMTLTRQDLQFERSQCIDEGKDISRFEAEFRALDVDEVDKDPKLVARANKLLDRTALLKPARGHQFVEPSRLPDIKRKRGRKVRLPSDLPPENVLYDKAYGAWAGRCCGCLLGKPVEGRRREQIENYLKSQNRWPLSFYFSNAAAEQVRKDNCFPQPSDPCYLENIQCMVEDDDTNYTAVGLAIVRNKGRDFAPADVAKFWLGNIPLYHVCTAERVAYRNLVNLLPVPDNDGNFAGKYSSATLRNPYREWIGAQIRADFFGYCASGDCELAAELAWRDACISHIKNGIYGEMWVAAMLAAAAVSDDVETVIRAGLAQAPARSRFVRDIEEVFQWRTEGLTYVQAVDRLHAKWDQANGHQWCHTNSNAQVVAIALLWGDMDYGRTVCFAVMPGFDTDCNGATAGSVLGMMLGHSNLPQKWLTPINDTLQTGVHGYYTVKLSDLAAQTVEIGRKLFGSHG